MTRGTCIYKSLPNFPLLRSISLFVLLSYLPPASLSRNTKRKKEESKEKMINGQEIGKIKEARRKERRVNR